MSKILYPFFLFVLSASTGWAVPAEDDYEPFLQEGKVWNYEYNNFMTGQSYKYQLQVRGDTVVGGRNCKQIWQNDGTACLYIVFEEDRKVYEYYRDTFYLIYDFGCSVGDVIPLNGCSAKVSEVETVEYNGKHIRRIKGAISYDPESEPFHDTFVWMEGIGSSMSFLSSVPVPGDYNQFVSCEINGQPLYTEAVFSLPGEQAELSIHDGMTEEDTQETSPLFDLQGRRIANPHAKGLYIKDNKKVIRR